MNVNPAIFKAYDIRGVYDTDFDDAFAQDLVSRLVASTKAKTVVIGRDGRSSSGPLEDALVSGAREAGCRVIVIGTVSTPLFYFASRMGAADLGIMVTASHNPGEYNGFKVIGPNALDLDGGQLKTMYEQNEPRRADGGVVEQRSFRDEYVAAVKKMTGFSGGEIPFEVHAPDAVGETLSQLCEVRSSARITASFDSDGDRVRFSEEGTDIHPTFIFLLLCERLKPVRVVHDLLFPHSVLRRLKEMGIETHVSRVGRVFVPRTMEEAGAQMGAETSSHYYFSSFGGWESPEAVLLWMAQIVGPEGSLIALTKDMATTAYRDDISFPATKPWPAVHDALTQVFGDGKSNELDGLTVEYDDTWWFNVRPSNTEPVIRVTAEAPTKEFLDERLARLKEILS